MASQNGTARAPKGALSIRGRELAALTVLTLSVVAITTITHLYHSRQLLWTGTLREAELVARQIYSQSAHTLAREAPADPWPALRRDRELRALLDASVGYAPWLLYAIVADQTGTAMVHSDAKREGERVPPQPSFHQLVSGNPLQRFGTLGQGPQIYEVVLPFDLDGRPFAAIRLGIALALLRTQLEDALQYTVVATVLALVAALAVGIALSGVTLKPIRRLAQDMERLRQGEFDVGSPAGPKDEFGKLAYQLQLLGQQMRSDRTRVLAERSHFQSAADQLEDGLMLWSSDARVLFANRAVEIATGKPGKDLTGATLDSVFPAEHPLRQIVRRAVDGRPARNMTVEVRADGGPAQLLASAFPVAGREEAPDGALLVVRDLKAVSVSARTFQSLIQYSAQLAALGQVTSEVTHDVKNPLHAMRVHVAVLKERLASQPPDVRRSLDVLEAEIARADSVVNRFMEAVRGDISLKPLDLNALVQDVATLLEVDWSAKGVTVTAQLEGGLGPVLGDEGMLRRAFMNIILNACQAMPGGGTVSIASERDGDQLVKVTVTDTGGGIPPEQIDKIFATYYTTKPEGTGLGLSLVRRVVEMHRGDIRLLSTVGQGTSVIVRLPAAAA